MMAAKLVILLLALDGDGAVPAAKLDVSPLEKGCHRRLEVAGFSDNERAIAVTQTIICPAGPDQTDHFAITDLIELKTRRVLASYQSSPISRTAGNKPQFVPPKQLRDHHRSWAHALPQHLWTKVRRAGHFKLHVHDFKDVMVRMRLDADSPMDVRAEHDSLVLTAPPNVPIGCTAVGRLVDGSEVDLGHVRDEAPSPGNQRGSLKMVFSAHGHVLALVHRGLKQDTITLTRTPNTQPIASTQVGFMQMLKWDADSVKKLFGEIHPEGREVWDEMVGQIE